MSKNTEKTKKRKKRKAGKASLATDIGLARLAKTITFSAFEDSDTLVTITDEDEEEEDEESKQAAYVFLYKLVLQRHSLGFMFYCLVL